MREVLRCWSAPTKFLGNQTAAYDGALHFELSKGLTDNQWNQEDVILVGGGLVLAYETSSNPLTTFTAYDVSLAQGIWHVGSRTGALATQADMLQALGSLSAMYIRAEFHSGTETDSLDNVILSAPDQSSAVPEPGSAALVAAGLLPLFLKTRRRKGVQGPQSSVDRP